MVTEHTDYTELNAPIPRLRRVLPRERGRALIYLVRRRRARRLLILRASDGGT